MIKGLNILIVSPEPWGPLRLSKHHYAVAALELGASVYFLQPPDGSVSKLSLEKTVDGVHILVQPSLPRGLRFLPSAVRRSHERGILRSIEKIASSRFDVIWNFDRYQFRFLTRTDYDGRMVIFHLVDFPSDKNFDVQVGNADICIGVTEELCDQLNEQGAADTIHIGHSFAPRPVSRVSHPMLRGDNVKIGCIGNMAIESIDLDSLQRIAGDHPDVEIFLIGPHGNSNLSAGVPANSDKFKELISNENVHWVGAVPWTDIPGWMDAMAGLIVAYDPIKFKQVASNSHKLLEYFSSGKPILSSYLAGLGAERELILMTEAGSPVSTGFDRLLHTISDPKSDIHAAQRKAFANDRTYAKTTSAILQALLEKGSGINNQ